MEDKINEKSPQMSLLHLNDYCLMDIVKFLEYHDLVKLSNTCTKLRAECVRVCFKKYRKIEMLARVQMPLGNQVDPNIITQQDFKEFSTMVGKNYLRIKEMKSQTDTDKDVELLFTCTPQLSNREESRPVRNHRKLKLPDIIISANDIKKCFVRNPEMQCEYSGSYDPNVMELLVHLPNLTSLQIEPMLNSLADPRWNAKIFDIIPLFANLEVLSLVGYINFDASDVPENVVCPSKLKKIIIYVPAMPFKVFTSIVEKLEFLEEIDLGRSRMYWYHGNTVSLGSVLDPLLIPQIVSAFNQRKLNIFTSDPSKAFQSFHQSENLNIINRYNRND